MSSSPEHHITVYCSKLYLCPYKVISVYYTIIIISLSCLEHLFACHILRFSSVFNIMQIVTGLRNYGLSTASNFVCQKSSSLFLLFSRYILSEHHQRQTGRGMTTQPPSFCACRLLAEAGSYFSTPATGCCAVPDRLQVSSGHRRSPTEA